MRVYLVGMPGSGKTVLGAELAALLKIPFFDLDEGIESQEGMSIPEIFEKEGEKYFRTLESKLLRQFPELTGHFVLSTGGGAPCFFDNMGFMNDEGKTIYLKVPVTTLSNRLLDSGSKDRPLLNGKSKEELESFLSEQLEARKFHYEKAGLTVEGDNISVQDLRDQMKKIGW